MFCKCRLIFSLQKLHGSLKISFLDNWLDFVFNINIFFSRVDSCNYTKTI